MYYQSIEKNYSTNNNIIGLVEDNMFQLPSTFNFLLAGDNVKSCVMMNIIFVRITHKANGIFMLFFDVDTSS